MDDEAAMRDSLAALVAAADYRCLAFASGEAFLAAPLPPIPRCLLLDMALNGLSGLDVQRELAAQDACLPILFVSGEDNVDRATRAMKAGAMDFLQKPFDPEHLLARIECAL
ncbi:MAG: response regulator, partial [Salinisphaera sp.]|nr:response regulator [Salinisphaera sp.]